MVQCDDLRDRNAQHTAQGAGLHVTANVALARTRPESAICCTAPLTSIFRRAAWPCNDVQHPRRGWCSDCVA